MQSTRFAAGTPRAPALFLAFALARAGVTHAHAQAQDAPAHGHYQVRMTLDVHGQTSTPLLVAQEDQPFAIAGDSAGKPWRATFIVHRSTQPDTVRVDGKITDGDAVLAAPALVGRLGERMAIAVDDAVAVSLVVNEAQNQARAQAATGRAP